MMEPMCSDGAETKWNAIVFTCQSRESANCFQKGISALSLQHVTFIEDNH